MRKFGKLLPALALWLALGLAWAQPPGEAPGDLGEAALRPVADIVAKEIQAGNIPGAVVLVGHQGKVVFRRAFGYRAQKPEKLAMTEDTIFDLASLTKVVATTTAVMQLVEQGKLDLEAPVAGYWPEFGAGGKERITVRQVLTHYSGLRADLDLKADWSGYDAALGLIAAERPAFPPGTGYLYSDINFEILGELVRRVSGQPLDEYCDRHIFKPLGMKDTTFHPSPAQRARIAPTEPRQGRMQPGVVHDPTAYRMGGVAGHAGLFATADDLAAFAQMLLDRGSHHGVQILLPATVDEMTTAQSPPGGARLRGLGWDIHSPLAPNRDEMLSAASYGHTGFTGTSIWVDPASRTYVIVLTNRVHPDGKGNAGPLRAQIAALVAEALGSSSSDQALAGRRGAPTQSRAAQDRKVESGVDVLVAERFAPLRGLRVGLIANHTGIDSAGRRTIDLLSAAPGVKLAAIFTPEHGLYGNLDEKVASGAEPTTGLPIHSLYGDVKRPTPEMLDGLDALVFDIQDAGARFYTYATTMAYAMESAAQKGIAFYVLDRPNPIGASLVQGPVLDPDLTSFAGYFPLPVRHGMTIGELAQLFNAENHIGAELHVIGMRGYRRADWYDGTGLAWIGPSPNLRTLTQAALYPGVAMVEGANVSVGRGTDTPFELVGAPWIDAQELSAYLNRRDIPGVRFAPVDFRPTESRYRNRVCQGVRIDLVDRRALDSPALGIEIASALHRLYPKDFLLGQTLGLIGARRVLQAIEGGEDPRSIAARWQGELDTFAQLRAKYLLY